MTFSEENRLAKYIRNFFTDRRDEWVKSRTALIEKFPFLTVTTQMPYPIEKAVWRDYLHLDGYICFFNEEAQKEIIEIKNRQRRPATIDEEIIEGEDSYFKDNLDECPYYNGFENFEDFLDNFVHEYRAMKKEVEQLREENEILGK